MTIGTWLGETRLAAVFRGVQQLKPFQRVNHFPSPGHKALFDNDMKD